ncbi:MAG: PKD domain-containing protein [Myxococcales bacterium]|nr:PKD domain-containing protein [Myxococcales bacterium]
MNFTGRLPFFVLFLTFLTGVLVFSTPARAAWIYETVASTGDQGQYSSLALDSANTPHVAFYDASNGKLRYGYRDFAGWHVSDVDSGNRGDYAQIAINPVNDYPAIAYYDQEGGRLRYAYWDGDDWNIEVIDENEDDGYIGDYCDLTFNADGTPYISYHFDESWFENMGTRVAWRTAPNTWSIHDLDVILSTAGVTNFGRHTAIAMSTANRPQIAYRDDILGYQKFGWLDGGGWHFEIALDWEQAGEQPSLALDSGDNVFISSYNTETIGDECACIISKVAGDWALENVECGAGNFGQYTSVAVDGNDALHLAYYGADRLNYAVETPDGWDISVIDETGVTGLFVGLALDGDAHPYFVYYDSTAKDVKFVFVLDPPAVAAIDPDNAPNTGPLTGAAVTGDRFEAASEVALVRPDSKVTIAGENVTVLSGQSLTCDFELAGVLPGVYALQVSNQAGTTTLENAFTVTTLSPELTSIAPASGGNDETAFAVELSGNYFTLDMTVSLKRDGEWDIVASGVELTDTTAATAVFNLKNERPGDWDVVVETPYGAATIEDGFEIFCGEPVADFTAVPKAGYIPLTVQFADASADFGGCEITAYEWDFGDGGTSTEKNPQHTYETAGIYSVTLTVTAPGGTDAALKTDYIKADALPGDDDDDTAPVDDDSADDDDDDNDNDDNDDVVLPDDDSPLPNAGDDDEDSGSCGC